MDLIRLPQFRILKGQIHMAGGKFRVPEYYNNKIIMYSSKFCFCCIFCYFKMLLQKADFDFLRKDFPELEKENLNKEIGQKLNI